MQLWSRLKSLARNLLQKSAAESELDEELRCYAETITEEKIAAGMSPAEARRTTLADIGGIEQVKQSVRDRRAGVTLRTPLAGCALRLPSAPSQPRLHPHRRPHAGARHRRHYRHLLRRLCSTPPPAPLSRRQPPHVRLGKNVQCPQRRARLTRLCRGTNRHEIVRAVRRLLLLLQSKPHRPGRTLTHRQRQCDCKLPPHARSRSAAWAPLCRRRRPARGTARRYDQQSSLAHLLPRRSRNHRQIHRHRWQIADHHRGVAASL